MLVQVAIALFGVTAIWMVNGTPKQKLWAPVVGLAGQPFWLYATVSSEQWGMVVVSGLYTIAWARGIVLNLKGAGS